MLHGRGKRGRPRKYGSETIEALKTVCEAEDRQYLKRLNPFLGDLVKILKKHVEIKITPVVEKQIHQISPLAIDWGPISHGQYKAFWSP